MIRKYARAAREYTDAALLWLAFEPAGRYLNWKRKRKRKWNEKKK